MKPLRICTLLLTLLFLAAGLPAQTVQAPRLGTANSTLPCQYTPAFTTLTGAQAGSVLYLQCNPAGYLQTALPAEAVTEAAAVSATATFTTNAQPADGKTYDLLLTLASLAGTYTTCTLQPQVSGDDSNWVNEGSAIALTMTAGTTVAQTTQAVVGAWHRFLYACNAYGSAGTVTLTEVFHQS